MYIEHNLHVSMNDETRHFIYKRPVLSSKQPITGMTNFYLHVPPTVI